MAVDTLLIDGDPHLFKVGFVAEKQNMDFAQASGLLRKQFNDIINTLRGRCDGRAVAWIYFTGSGSTPYRYQFNPQYKASRKTRVGPRPRFINELKDNYLCGAEALDLVYNVGLSDPAFGEADDLICTHTWGMRKSGKENDYIVASVDKDLKQIPGVYFNPNKITIEYIDEVTAEYNFYTQMLTGDKTDDIPGIPGIGPVRAARVLAQRNPDSVEGYFESVFNAYVEHYGKTKTESEIADIIFNTGNQLYLRRHATDVWQPPI